MKMELGSIQNRTSSIHTKIELLTADHGPRIEQQQLSSLVHRTSSSPNPSHNSCRHCTETVPPQITAAAPHIARNSHRWCVISWSFDNMPEFGLIILNRYCEFVRYKLIEALLWDKTQRDFKLSKYGLCCKEKKNTDDGIDTALGHNLI